MGFWKFKLFVLFFWAIFSRVSCVGNELYAANYITWDDLKINMLVKEGVELRVSANKTRVIIVDQSGRGDSFTVQGAVDMVPLNNTERVKIYIRPGIYREKVHVPYSKPYVSFIGDESKANETIITWNSKASDRDWRGIYVGTSKSASVTIESDFFCATAITFENSVVAIAGELGMQAVALRISGDKALLFRVRILGTQDTLLDDKGSHFIYQSYIQGSVDFIFGRARSLYKECVIHSVAETYGAIAAHHRSGPYDETGFSFVNCTIYGSGEVYLGRAWGNYSRIIYSYCDMKDNVIKPDGWSDWGDTYKQTTAVFGEYENRGTGAGRSKRVAWSKLLNFEEAKPFLYLNFISGQYWLKL